MKTRGSDLVVKALEDEDVRFTFGIPGTHNIELYDSLDRSKKIEPILVTDEQSASFMADGVSRTSGSVGVVNVVPGAGVTHCLSGVAEAFMDNVPMVVLACGIRKDTGKAYQLHDINQLALLGPVTKAVMKPVSHSTLYGTVRRAFAIAREGTPGPVAVEVPADLYMLTAEVPDPVFVDAPFRPPEPDSALLVKAASMLSSAEAPALYVGNGASGATADIVKLAELLCAPVTTTIQGKGVFPEDHPLWLWNGFGRSSPPFVREIMGKCDCLLALGVRFGEVATASYGLEPPANMIHVDINPEVFNRNYRAVLAVKSDAAAFVKGLLSKIGGKRERQGVEGKIAAGRKAVEAAQRGRAAPTGKVSPNALFGAIQELTGPNAVYVTDSGNGTFLAMEHLRLKPPRKMIAPVDYSCMGYAVPAAIGAKLANTKRDVVAVTGDGALLMTGLELLTAAEHEAAPVVCVLRDGELGQIAKFQRASGTSDAASILSDFSVESFAKAAGCGYAAVSSDADVASTMAGVLDRARAGEPVLVEVPIDYSQTTYFTKGVIATNFWRYPWSERMRLAARFARRKLPF